MTSSSKMPTQPRRRRQASADPLDPLGEIAARLRALYAEIEQEAIPADLIALLERLDEAESRSKS